jgi:hypothetical protein
MTLFDTDFVDFDPQQFKDAFWKRRDAKNFGKALLVAVSTDIAACDAAKKAVESESADLNKLPAVLVAVAEVLRLHRAAVPAVQRGQKTDEDLLSFVARVSNEFVPGLILQNSCGEKYGSALRMQWGARKMKQALMNYLGLRLEDALGPQLALISAKVSLTLTFAVSLLTGLFKDRSAAVRRAVRQQGMQRLVPDGFGRLGGYGVPSPFARGEAEEYEDHIARCVQAYRSARALAIEDMRQFEDLVEDVRLKGISALKDCGHLVLVPALAPLNAKTSGKKQGGPSEQTWTTLLRMPILMVFSEAGCSPFATATTSLEQSDARVQQALRNIGKKPFSVAAMSAGLPFGEPADGSSEQDVLCPACRAGAAARAAATAAAAGSGDEAAHDVAAAAAASAHPAAAAGVAAHAGAASAGGAAARGAATAAAAAAVPVPAAAANVHEERAACRTCAQRAENAAQFAGMGARILDAARENAEAKSACVVTGTGAKGEERAEHVCRVPGLGRRVDGVSEPHLLDNKALTRQETKAELQQWSEWVCRVALALHKAKLEEAPTEFQLFRVFRLFGIMPLLDWHGTETGAKSKKAATKQLAEAELLNQMVGVLNMASADVTDFLKQVLGKESQGEQIH